MADIDDEAASMSPGTEIGGRRGRGRSSWDKSLLIAKAGLSICVLLSILALMMVFTHAYDASRGATDFSMHLAGYAGLPEDNNTATTPVGHHTMAVVVSPMFRLRVQVHNPRRVHVLQPWCYNGGEVVVSYTSVALAWAHVPRFCIDDRRQAAPTEFRVSPLGRGVGLSEDLARRLAAELQQGTAQVTASMKLFYQDTDILSSRKYSGPSLHSFQLMLRGGEQQLNH